jgi:steroid 5-alpha reductase family enzyme
MADLLSIAALAIAVLMLITWVASVVIDDASIVDITWGLGFVIAVWAAYPASPVDAPTDRALLMAVLVTVWGLRLTGYLFWRNRGKGEDRRYQQMRRKTPDNFWLVSLYKVFGLQAVLMWVVAVPAVVTWASDSPLFWLDYVGVGLWLIGLVFESVGDIQLARFKSRPDSKGRVMDRGLWRYTRHPNYFGDFCVWWGMYLVAAAGGAWWTVFSPIVMSALLIRYSGAGLLEKTITRRRPGYEEYIRTTNAFFPGPAKHDRQTASGPPTTERPDQ